MKNNDNSQSPNSAPAPAPAELNQDQLNELENDNVWDILSKAEQASPIEASPMFARNVMREIRLHHNDAPVSFWQRLTAPKFNKIALSLGAAAACALMVTTVISNNDTTPGATIASADIDFIKDIPLEELTEYTELVSYDEPSAQAITSEDDAFTQEMLELADQDPFYISEDEIIFAMNM